MVGIGITSCFFSFTSTFISSFLGFNSTFTSLGYSFFISIFGIETTFLPSIVLGYP